MSCFNNIIFQSSQVTHVDIRCVAKLSSTTLWFCNNHTIDSKSVKIQLSRLCVVKSTNLDAKLGVGGKLFSRFSYNQNCCEVSILVILL